jgi:hypothetical protein
MTGHPDFNFPAFDSAAATLRAMGHYVMSPAEMDRFDGFDERGCTGHEPLTEEQRWQFARNDIGALLNVDGIVMLPGWRNSTGARHEHAIASWLGLCLWEYDPKLSTKLRDIEPGGVWSGATTSTPPAPVYKNARAEILLGAEVIVNGDRNAQYGDPRQDFTRTADMWSAYLGVPVQPHDVAALMALLKVSRIRWSPTKQDSWLDLAGYAACGWDCAVQLTQTQENHG